MDQMRRTSLVQAKARLSEIVDYAESKGRPTLICRRGKPAAVVVPVEVARGALGEEAPPRLSAGEIEKMMNELAESGDQSGEALQDLYDGRSRLEPARKDRG